MHEIEFTATARRALVHLPNRYAAAVIEFVYGPLAENPRRVGKPLRFELEGLHAARRGPYRVVYRIDEVRQVVRIEAIAHRADAYRTR